MTEDDIKRTIEAHTDLADKAARIVNELEKWREIDDDDLVLLAFDPEKPETVRVWYGEAWGDSSPTFEDVPIALLRMTDAELDAWEAERKREREEEEKRRREAEAQRRERHEYETFMALKAKYEGSND